MWTVNYKGTHVFRDGALTLCVSKSKRGPGWIIGAPPPRQDDRRVDGMAFLWTLEFPTSDKARAAAEALIPFLAE